LTDPNDRKQFVGNSIYQIIANAFGEQLAGRITGMLLDENVINFQQLLTNPVYFTTKSREAHALLMANMGSQVPQVQAQPLIQ
jgi:hypothetical protein